MTPFLTPRLAVSAMFFLNGALFGIWASRIPTIKDSLTLSHGQLGLCLLFMSLGAMVAFPVAGHLTDRKGAATVTKLLAVLYAVGLLLLPLAGNMPMLMLLIVFFGATHGGMDVAMNAWGADVERKMGKPIMTSFHAMFSLGAGLGAGSGYLALSVSMPVLTHFALAGTITTVACFALARAPWKDTPGAAGGAGPVFAFPKGALVLVGFVAFCSSIGEGAMADWSAVYLTGPADVSQQMAALGYASFSVTMVAMRLIGDRVIQAFGSVATARFGGLSAACGAALVASVPAFGPALAGFALMGVGYAVVVPLAFSRAANDPNTAPGRAIASVATLGYGGTLLGPAIIGFVAELTSLRVSFALLAVLALTLSSLAGVLRVRD
ncbi:MFS transporter [Pseudoprimorskyibacter insulae]|uniref:Inner membrane protein YbjJ n=1 Tax=Pseudoprimorskyibacter insulae TaxID=1695997 RepID=A0A2R8AQY5_9RHOB|nr:MFS transporter [Pseudoprimorskyibacter insulae]SPF78496.1 Inner membrane protein YbjJ [Pseudoprimorskyibacter insulae]